MAAVGCFMRRRRSTRKAHTAVATAPATAAPSAMPAMPGADSPVVQLQRSAMWAGAAKKVDSVDALSSGGHRHKWHFCYFSLQLQK